MAIHSARIHATLPRRASRSRHRIALTAAVSAALCAIVAFDAPTAAATTGAPISGAGSTWAENAILGWSANLSSAGDAVSYLGTGSSDGRNQFRDGAVDFAVSDLPYGLSDNGIVDPPPTRPFSYIPIVEGAVSFPYNLSIAGARVTGLRLSGLTVAKIFTRAVTVWNDPAIQADNPGLTLPAVPIMPVVRGDGSGTTEQLTQWLATQYPDLWNSYCATAGRTVPCGSTSFFPAVSSDVIQSLSTGVAGFVAQSQNVGAITYVESSYAQAMGLPSVKLLNAAGYYTAPSAGAVAVAMTTAQSGSSRLVNLDKVYSNPDPRAYPLSDISYLIVPTSTAAPFTTVKGLTLGAFVQYALCRGQQDSATLGYAPLDAALVQAGLTQIPSIPGAAIPTVDPTACADPSTSLIASTPQPQSCDQLGSTVCPGVPVQTPSQATQQITTAMPPGALVVSVPADSRVVLPSPVLDPSGLLLRTSGSISPLTVTDNRAGNPGWTVSGQVSDFTDGFGHVIAAQDLGWTPTVVDAAAAQIVTAGPTVLPVPDTTADGGLGTARTLATCSGLGTTHLTATLTLDVPTSTPAGTYTATLTLTAL